MKRSLYIIIPILLIALVVIKLKNNKEIAAKKIFTQDSTRPVPVLAQVIKSSVPEYGLMYTGTFEANRESKLSAELQGKVNSVAVDAGDFVEKGQALIQLDNALLKLQLQTVNVQIEGLEADVKRYTTLAEADAIQGMQLEKAQLGLKSALVQKATIEEQINKSTIRAPFSGVVTAKLTEEGAFAAPGVPLLQLTDISLLKFTISVSEAELKRFEIGEQYKINTDLFSDLVLQGKAIHISSKANAGSSFLIQFLLNNTPDKKIKAGMFGKLTPRGADTGNKIVIPASAVIGGDDNPQVYKVINGKAQLSAIRIAEKTGDKLLISSGLKDGDVLVTGGFINLADGAFVKVK